MEVSLQIGKLNNKFTTYITLNKIMKNASMMSSGRQRQLYSVQLDKGKKHFWNNQKSDYGFNQSLDRRLFYQIDRIQTLRRNYTTQKPSYYNDQTEGVLYHSLKHKNCGFDQPCPEVDRKKRNTLEIDNKIIEVKLPSIRNNTRQIATQSDELKDYNQNLQKYNSSLISLNKSKRLTPEQIFENDERRVRVRTQVNQYTNKARKVRYSPTYVCSIRNPLPTFKLYNPNTNNPVYQYGFNQ